MFRKTLLAVLTIAGGGLLVLGPLSYWRGFPGNALWIEPDASEPRIQVALIKGALHAVYSTPARPGGADHGLDFGGFYVKQRNFAATEAVGVGLPFWFLSTLCLLTPGVALIRGPLRRRRRARQGLCVHCGYNLTGLPEPRCPECGHGI